MYKTTYFKEIDNGKMSLKLLAKLDRARARAGIPFNITSSYRPKDIYSTHSKGLAVDIMAKNSRQRFHILKALIDEGFNRIGIYSKHIHVDISQEKDLKVIWYGTYKKK